MDPSLINTAQSAAVISMPQSFCFQNASSMTSLAVNSVPQQALSHIPIAPILSVNQTALPSPFVQPLNIPHQALSLSLNQQQGPQNIASNQSVTLGPVPSSINLGAQPVPIGHVVCSSDSAAAPNINFVSPTLFTVSGADNQTQFIQNPFGQFPIMLNNQTIFPTVNAVASLQSQVQDVVPFSQSLVMANQPVISAASSKSSAVVSLSSQPVSVFSIPTPSMSVAPIVKSSNINTINNPIVLDLTESDKNSKPDLVKKPDACNIVSSSTPDSKISITSSETTENQISLSKKIIMKSEIDNPQKSAILSASVCARMKFTPIDLVAPNKNGKSESPTIIDDSSNDENVESEVCSSSKNECVKKDPSNTSSPTSECTKKVESDSANSIDSTIDGKEKSVEKLETKESSSKSDIQGELADGKALFHVYFNILQQYLMDKVTIF